MGTLIMAFSGAACIVACTWDKRADSWDEAHGLKARQSELSLPGARLSSASLTQGRTSEQPTAALLDNQAQQQPGESAEDLRSESDDSGNLPASAAAVENPTSGTGEDQIISFSQLQDLGLQYWLISFCCVTIYLNTFPFFQVVSLDYLQKKFGFKTYNDKTHEWEPSSEALEITSSSNLVSGVLGPFLGLFVDNFGRRPYFMIASCLLFMVW